MIDWRLIDDGIEPVYNGELREWTEEKHRLAEIIGVAYANGKITATVKDQLLLMVSERDLLTEYQMLSLIDGIMRRLNVVDDWIKEILNAEETSVQAVLDKATEALADIERQTTLSEIVITRLTQDSLASIAEKTESITTDIESLKSDVEELDNDKMERYVIRLVKNADNTYKLTSIDDADLTFTEVYDTTRKLNNYVVVVYGNNKLRPQYVSTNEIMFIGLDRSTESKVLRILLTPTRLTYETFPIAEKSDLNTVTNKVNTLETTVGELNEDLAAKVSDVKINGTALEKTDGAVEIPVASGGNKGLVYWSADGNNGIWDRYSASGNPAHKGELRINPAGNGYISVRTSVPCPIVPSNLDYAVKAALTDGKGAAYTDAEKLAAQERLNAFGKNDKELIAEFEIDESTINRVDISLPKPVYHYLDIRVEAPLEDASKTAYIYTYLNGLQVTGSEFAVTNGQNRHYVKKFYLFAGDVFSFGAPAPPDYLIVSNYQFLCQSRHVEALTHISLRSIVAGKYMFEGMKFKIYGV